MTSILKVSEIQDPTNSNTALTIDSSGNIATGGRIDAGTSVYAQGSHSATISTPSVITFNANQITSGGCTFEDTNTSIKVPVAGLYMVQYSGLGNTGSGGFILGVEKNGVTISGSLTINQASNNEGASNNILVVLQANDKITFKVFSGASHGNADYNNFFVLKVG